METNEFHLLRKHAHEDLIHDVAFDFYGKRLVTASSDQRLKVWNLNEETEKWELNDTWSAHESAILRVAWAHPEYGQVIASCSADRSVKIWEELEHEPRNSSRRWKEKISLSEARGVVQDIEFAPHHLGLKIATVASDGIVRVYEAIEVYDLSSWTLMESFEVGPAFAKETEGQYCLSFAKSRFASQMLVVGCGKENIAKVFRLDQHNKWQATEVLAGHHDIVRDVAFAPSFGRTFHLIATACKDGRVRIYRLTANGDSYDVELVGNFADHGSEVWKVEWNVTGTILSSSGDDGKVRLWKATYTDEWKCMSVVSAEAGDAPTER